MVSRAGHACSPSGRCFGFQQPRSPQEGAARGKQAMGLGGVLRSQQACMPGGRGAKGARSAPPGLSGCSVTAQPSWEHHGEGGGTGHWRPGALQELPPAVSAPWSWWQRAGRAGGPPGAAGPGAMPRRHAVSSAPLAVGGDAACRPAVPSSGLAVGEPPPPQGAVARSGARAAATCQAVERIALSWLQRN